MLALALALVYMQLVLPLEPALVPAYCLSWI